MFLRLALLFTLLTVSLSAQVARPKLNDLEIRKHVMIAQAIDENAQRITSANQEVKNAAIAAVKAQKDFDQNSDSQNIAKLMRNKLTSAQKDKDAQASLKNLMDRQTQLRNQSDDWDVSVLESHQADLTKYKVDWDTGVIISQ